MVYDTRNKQTTSASSIACEAVRTAFDDARSAIHGAELLSVVRIASALNRTCTVAM